MTFVNPAASQSEGWLLLDNPFQVLGVSVRDRVAQIVEAAADPLLGAPAEQIERARLTLTNPRARLAAEVGWLPGVAPARARQVVEALSNDTAFEALEAGLPTAALANLLASVLDRTMPMGVEPTTALLSQVLQTVEAIDPADVLRDINEDRLLAGVPPVRSAQAVADALIAQTRSYLYVFRRYLDRLPTEVLVEVVTKIVEAETAAGQQSPSELVDALLDAYEVEALGFLEAEAATIRELAAAIVAQAGKGESHVRPAVDRLLGLLAAWDVVAQPLQLIRQAHGEGHALSRSLAADIRGATVDMVNRHGLVDLAAQINGALSQHFAEVADLRDVFEGDASALEDIRQSAADRGRSDAALAYTAKVGLGQTLLLIDGREVAYGEDRFAIEQVDRVRWGGTSNSINGIPTGTTYLIAFGAGGRECEISTRSKQVFAEFTSRLWRTCGVAIAVRLLGRLRAGEQVRVGDIQFTDDRVLLSKSKFLAKAEVRAFAWADVQVWSDSGEFFVGAKADRGFRAKASYQSHANTHVLSNVVNNAFDRGIVKLSAVLE